jgi:predicted Zn-dependent protease with MMP-like domain
MGRRPIADLAPAGTLIGMMHVSLERFEELTAEALDELPAWVHERLDNVEVVIEDLPPAEQPNLLGLYQGVPLTKRGDHYFGVVPDRITLFRRTIQAVARDDGELVREVRRVVVHEVAHFFGISDDRLREMDRY